jgi:hypothetical protein
MSYPTNISPDGIRYWKKAQKVPVSRPFNMRWLLPKVCGTDVRVWTWVWLASWPVMVGAMVWWRVAAGDDWWVAIAAAGLLAGLPGILGPTLAVPIQVDLPATALVLVGCAVFEAVHPAAGITVIAVAAMIRETAPVVAALWLWSLWPLLAVFPVIVAAVVCRPGPDPLGPKYQEIADHPIRTGIAAHRGMWRDGWVMVAPWGACLAALVGADWKLVVVLTVAYLQLLVATDTIRLIHHVAGPPMAIAAATMIPSDWLLLAVVVHSVWWFRMERV